MVYALVRRHHTGFGRPAKRCRHVWCLNPSALPSLDAGLNLGYTTGMKTAISLPDEVFDQAEHMAKRLKVSRSELYSRALKEYLARHAPDRVTKALNQLCDELGTESDAFVAEAGRRILEQSEW